MAGRTAACEHPTWKEAKTRSLVWGAAETQIAFEPTITYDARATSGNKWNVSVGLNVAKTTLIGKLPVKFQLGVEYSVVSQDTYGDQGKLVLGVIPVIPALIYRSILGGGN